MSELCFQGRDFSPDSTFWPGQASAVPVMDLISLLRTSISVHGIKGDNPNKWAKEDVAIKLYSPMTVHSATDVVKFDSNDLVTITGLEVNFLFDVKAWFFKSICKNKTIGPDHCQWSLSDGGVYCSEFLIEEYFVSMKLTELKLGLTATCWYSENHFNAWNFITVQDVSQISSRCKNSQMFWHLPYSTNTTKTVELEWAKLHRDRSTFHYSGSFPTVLVETILLEKKV